MTRKRRKLRLKSPLIPLTVLVLAVSAVGFVQTLTVGDFTEIDRIEVYGEDLLLGAECRGIVGKISVERGHYIQIGKEGKLDNRPNIYDVFRDTLEQFEIEVESVKITHIEDNAFQSILTLSTRDKILEADARPSDAIALALRTDTKVYMSKALLEEKGANIC